MPGPYVIGVDGGTESLRAGVFDLAGTPLAFATSPYETTFPRPGWAEQDPQTGGAGWVRPCVASLPRPGLPPATLPRSPSTRPAAASSPSTRPASRCGRR